MSRSIVVVAALLSLWSATAFAQQNERDAFLTSVAVTSTTTVVGGAILAMTLPGGKADLEQYIFADVGGHTAAARSVRGR